jgi:hypothetical protein
MSYSLSHWEGWGEGLERNRVIFNFFFSSPFTQLSSKEKDSRRLQASSLKPEN